MTIPQSGKRNLRKPLRLWPGVVAVVLLLVARFGLKAVLPGFRGFALGMQWALGAALAVILWWAFFSRARWSERVGVIVLMIVGLAATWYLRHESMGPAVVLRLRCPDPVPCPGRRDGGQPSPRRWTSARDDGRDDPARLRSVDVRPDRRHKRRPCCEVRLALYEEPRGAAPDPGRPRAGCLRSGRTDGAPAGSGGNGGS